MSSQATSVYDFQRRIVLHSASPISDRNIQESTMYTEKTEHLPPRSLHCCRECVNFNFHTNVDSRAPLQFFSFYNVKERWNMGSFRQNLVPAALNLGLMHQSHQRCLLIQCLTLTSLTSDVLAGDHGGTSFSRPSRRQGCS